MGDIDKYRMILDKIFMIRKAPSVMLNTATSFNDGEEKVVCGNTGLRNYRRSWMPVITQIDMESKNGKEKTKH